MSAARADVSILHRVCPAKLNLGLRVIRRRADGYHELDTVFQELDLHDDLWITRRDASGVELELVGADDPGEGRGVVAGDDNLVVRAARAALAAAGVTDAGLRFALRKRIPAGGGLGGGSSDAAAALLLTDALLDLGLTPAQLASLAVSLGADVPFFLAGGTQRGTGVGERLDPVSMAPQLDYLLVMPPFGCDTAAVFAEYHRELESASGGGDGGVTYPPPGGPDGDAGPFPNDLEPAALRLRPQLAALRDALLPMAHGRVRMSGSGSTLFLWRPAAGGDDPVEPWRVALTEKAQAAVPGTRLLATRTRRETPVVRPGGWREVPTR